MISRLCVGPPERRPALNDEKIYYVIAAALALTIVWIGASMMFGPFGLSK